MVDANRRPRDSAVVDARPTDAATADAALSVPTTIYLAAVPYATANAGTLVSAAQTPQGNGDGNVDAAEFVAVSLTCR